MERALGKHGQPKAETANQEHCEFDQATVGTFHASAP
jgi:hypothetical protein